MKRYIRSSKNIQYVRASLDPSIPGWLRGQSVIKELGEQYAMSEAKFYKEEQPDSIPIYLLDTVYPRNSKWQWGKSWPEVTYTKQKNYAYCPQVGDEGMTIGIGDKHYSLDSIKSRGKVRDAFDRQVKDIVYMVAPLRSSIRSDEDRYVDPRYEGFRDGGWHYAGQQKLPTYNKKTRKWDGEPEWRMPVSYNQRRDKSGYAIPDPADLYERAYAKFPDKLKAKIDKIRPILDDYYDRLIACKDKIMDVDIKKGRGFDPINPISSVNMHHFNEAVSSYGYLYSALEGCMDAEGNVDPAELSKFVNNLNYDLAKIDEHLEYLE